MITEIYKLAKETVKLEQTVVEQADTIAELRTFKNDLLCLLETLQISYAGDFIFVTDTDMAINIVKRYQNEESKRDEQD